MSPCRWLHYIGADTALQNHITVSATDSNETMSDQTAVVSPQTPEANMIPDDKVLRAHQALEHAVMAEQAQQTSSYTYPIDTSIAPPSVVDRSTPRAQTREEFDEEVRRRSRVSVSLAGKSSAPLKSPRANAAIADIAESGDDAAPDSASVSASENDDSAPSQPQSHYDSQPPTEASSQRSSPRVQTMNEALLGINETEREVAALRSALDECWTLCNTLAKLSQSHRQRIFHYSGGRGDIQEQAWRTCWRLCQKLYETRHEEHERQIMPILELCRDFCQALFEVRHRNDEAADSVLRVSFELNNHLYNAHDRTLPEAFRERTLDFYVTLCHRLMKQNTSLPEETDALLHACWQLAEMLFSIRQNSRDGKGADEELLGSAIQACWDLCDMFRDGWTQVRPERGTPRPAQYSFHPPSSVTHSQVSFSDRSAHSSNITGSYHSAMSIRRQQSVPPETPTTIYDDRDEMSPADDANVPNILVLGPEAGQTRTHDRWSSAASSLSTYSDTSIHTSSTATAGREDPNLIRLKGLIVKAAINTGYSRQTPLPDFVRALPSNSFGSVGWQAALFENYRKLVLTDPTLRTIHTQPLRRLTASEIARSVQWMSRSQKFLWMRDLYRFVFGSFPEDLGQRNMIINA